MAEQKSQASLTGVIRNLRLALFSPGEGGEVGAVVREARAFLKKNPPQELPEKDKSETAHLLYAVAQKTQQPQVAFEAMATLLSLGAVGETLLVKHLEDAGSLHVLKQTMERFQPHECLLVLNRFLEIPRHVDHRLQKWAVTYVSDLQRDDQDEVFLFLEALAERGETPADLIQRLLVGGRFRILVTDLLKMELSSEQISYLAKTLGALRSAGLMELLVAQLKQQPDEVVGDILQALVVLGPNDRSRLIMTATLLLRHKSVDVKKKALEAMQSMRAVGVADAAVDVALKQPALLGTASAALLGTSEDEAEVLFSGTFARFAARMAAVQSAVVSALDGVSLDMTPKENAQWSSLLKELGDPTPASNLQKRFVQHHVAFLKAGADSRPKPADRVKAMESAAEKDIFAVIKEKFLGNAKKDADESSRMTEFIKEKAVGGSIGKAFCKYVNVSGTSFKDATFDGASFLTSQLSDASFEKVKFVRCRFINVDFSRSRFAESRFIGCTFKNCLFSDTTFTKSLLRRSSFDVCIFSYALFRGVKMIATAVESCDMFGATFQHCSLKELKLTASNFTAARFKAGECSGVVWRDCLLKDMHLHGGSYRNTLFIACEVKDIFPFEVETDVPLLLKHEELRRSRLAHDFMDALVKDAGKDAESNALLPQLTPDNTDYGKYTVFLKDAAYRRDIMRRGAAMQDRNDLRASWGWAKLGPEKATFAAMLPLLVELDAVLSGEDIAPAPACSIAGYAPDYEASHALAKHFSPKDLKAMREKAGPQHAKRSPIPVDGLYIIGSIGTVAQTATSDIDLWLCVDGSIVSQKELEELKQKLTAIERFAEDVYDLEVHFFTMDLKDVRENNFGFTDKESAGSSQAKLLKEEFYRTVIHMAGRKPAWWYVPPQLDAPEYAAHLERFAELRPEIYRSVADLGPLESVDYKEFFGAAMWQIIKALKSPFKSVLKFGLMESYYKTRGKEMGVADTIKERILYGDRDFWNLDAYAVLFKRLYEYYSKQGDDRAIELMRMSFLQRTGMIPASGGVASTVSGNDGAALLEYYFPESPADVERKLLSASADAEKISALKNFDAFQKVGAEVGRYMFQSYEMVSRNLREKSSEAAISAEDMTKLGRKLISCLQPKKNKVGRVPFIHSPKGLFSSLDISCESEAGKKPVWIVKAYTKSQEGEKGSVEEIRRDMSLFRLLAWLTGNKLFTPKVHWQSSSLKDPIAYADIDLLLKSFYEFLPPAVIFEPEFEEYMEAEQVLYAFMPVNFFAFRSMEKIVESGLVYATNWGEMFHVDAPKKPELLMSAPLEFIKTNAHVPPHPECRTRILAPHKSAVARRVPEEAPA